MSELASEDRVEHGRRDEDLCCAGPFSEVLDEAAADDLAALLKAIADPVRLRLLSMIASAPSGEICACELPALLGRTQPTVSHHLSVLARHGLIDREQRGKWAWFRMRPERLAAIGSAIDPHRGRSAVPAASGP